MNWSAITRSCRGSLALLVTALAVAGCASAPGGGMRQGYMFVGGRYVDAKAGPIMERQMYVEYRIPARVTKRYPLVMIHGAAQTGTNFTGTPDGRKGWADYFVEQGYAVYVVDQPTRGRSPYNDAIAPVLRFPANQLERRFTATANFNLWPQAKLHTQFPGEGPNKGLRGDPIFDQFYASQVQYIGVATVNETMIREATAALLDKIGPAIILTHSQSGSFGWVIADERPNLVKGIIAAEPSGPPFRNAVFGTQPARPWGITSTRITYDPPVTDPSQLQPVEQAAADGPDLVRCMLQADPPRKLVTLQGIPIMIFVAEASYHAMYDHCTAKYLNQAGVKTDFIRLEDVGLRGNGQMVMIEKNNLEIAAMIARWLDAHVR